MPHKEKERNLIYSGRLPLPDLKNIKIIQIIGPSGAGKTTLISTLKDNYDLCEGRVQTPIRYTTRQVRFNELHSENKHLDHSEFKNKIDTGEINIYWNRQLTENQIDFFGFSIPKNINNQIFVLSGNNGITKGINISHQEIRTDNILTIGVFADSEVRRQRIIERSPDIYKNLPKEFSKRVQDPTIIVDHCHFLIKNSSCTKSDFTNTFLTIIKSILTDQEVPHTMGLHQTEGE